MKARFIFIALMAGIAFSACKKDEISSGPRAITPHDFLSGDDYKSLTVEVCYVTGHQPTNEALNAVMDMLSARLNKPEGIQIAYHEIASPRLSSFTTDDLKRLDKSVRDHYTKGKKLAVFVFFADAPYAESSGNYQVLGLAYGTTSMAIFEKTVEDYSNGLGEPSRYVLEATVCEHEFGHLLGLVDNGTPMVSAHLDAAHPHHCDDHNCLMYYTTETTDILSNLTGGNIPVFDDNCLADLKANGGK
ncbi:MAG TPA: peptidase [Bacteroidia bacterium]|nr:peptidase [Bacteroidia bacterium]